MNRPLRFRAWDADLKQMMPAIDLSGPVSTYQWLGAYDLPIMQFTGLRDSHGVEIFEGDIVKLKNSAEYPDSNHMEGIGEIKYEAPNWKAFYGEDGFYSMVLHWGGTASIEVIGNVWENPDLLAV